MDELLTTEYEWSPSTCAGVSEVHIHTYIQTDRQNTKHHLFVIRGAENV
jgi:hypothetical protein